MTSSATESSVIGIRISITLGAVSPASNVTVWFRAVADCFIGDDVLGPGWKSLVHYTINEIINVSQ